MYRPPPGSEGSPTKSRIKWEGVVRGAAPHLLALLLGDAHFHRDTDKELLEYTILESVTDRVDIRRTVNKYPWPFQNRDNVFLSTWKILDDGRILLVNKTIQHPKYPETPATFVRMENHFGFLLAPVEGSPNDTHMVIYADFDVKGDIPKKIIDPFVAKTCGRFEILSQYILSKQGQALIAELMAHIAQESHDTAASEADTASNSNFTVNSDSRL